MRADLRQRLRELSVVKGARELATLPPRPHVSIEDLVPGHFLDHLHSNLPLSVFLDLSPEIAARVGRADELARVDLGRASFLDTETTGLSGGTGTMAFVVGLGFFAEQHYHVSRISRSPPV